MARPGDAASICVSVGVFGDTARERGVVCGIWRDGAEEGIVFFPYSQSVSLGLV